MITKIKQYSSEFLVPALFASSNLGIPSTFSLLVPSDDFSLLLALVWAHESAWSTVPILVAEEEWVEGVGQNNRVKRSWKMGTLLEELWGQFTAWTEGTYFQSHIFFSLGIESGIFNQTLDKNPEVVFDRGVWYGDRFVLLLDNLCKERNLKTSLIEKEKKKRKKEKKRKEIKEKLGKGYYLFANMVDMGPSLCRTNAIDKSDLI